jgi:mono/diheme cytochrome c family protein
MQSYLFLKLRQSGKWERGRRHPTSTNRVVGTSQSLPDPGKQGILPNGGAATDAGIRNVVINGKNKMPGLAGRFDEGQMTVLTAYLRTDMAAE